MSKFLHDDNYTDNNTNAIGIPRVFSENSWTISFILAQNKSICRPQLICRVKKFNFSLIGSKTLLEKEKTLFTSIFSLSNDVFKRLLSDGRKNTRLFDKGLRK